MVEIHFSTSMYPQYDALTGQDYDCPGYLTNNELGSTPTIIGQGYYTATPDAVVNAIWAGTSGGGKIVFNTPGVDKYWSSNLSADAPAGLPGVFPEEPGDLPGGEEPPVGPSTPFLFVVNGTELAYNQYDGKTFTASGTADPPEGPIDVGGAALEATPHTVDYHIVADAGGAFYLNLVGTALWYGTNMGGIPHIIPTFPTDAKIGDVFEGWVLTVDANGDWRWVNQVTGEKSGIVGPPPPAPPVEWDGKGAAVVVSVASGDPFTPFKTLTGLTTGYTVDDVAKQGSGTATITRSVWTTTVQAYVVDGQIILFGKSPVMDAPQPEKWFSTDIVTLIAPPPPPVDPAAQERLIIVVGLAIAAILCVGVYLLWRKYRSVPQAQVRAAQAVPAAAVVNAPGGVK